MCLTANGKEKIAEADIPVVKYLRGLPGCFGIVRYETPMTRNHVSKNVVSGKDLMVADGEEDVQSFGYVGVCTVGGGFVHSFMEGSMAADAFACEFHDLVCFRCVIPKGERYWVSVNGSEYASKSLRFIERVE